MASAKQILASSSQGGFVLLDDHLESILLKDDVLDKPVVLISVAGAFRKGKSFLLDMMLRYLTATDKQNWLDETNSRSAGFPWQGGYRRHTTGILMWSSPFPVTLPTGEEAVIVLMDTQGTFDNQSTVHESATVFALSTLLSSLQIFNLMGHVQNDDLENLQLFTEYGRMALDDSRDKPFQKLLFLVRDWQHIDDLPLGSGGGHELVSDWLHSKTGKKELAKVRQHIRECFTDITGFLLPHPGQKVASSRKFDGNSKDMEPKFAEGLQELMPKILSPENLTIKTIAGNNMKAKDLVTYMRLYVNLFKGDKLPKPKNILTATAEANNMAAAHEAKSLYMKEMADLASEDQPSMPEHELLARHREASRKAEEAFRNRKKMGDWKLSEQYFIQLVKEMEDWFKFAEQANTTKREKERLNAENHNMSLTEKCKETYLQEMQEVAGEEVGYVPPNDMDNAHGKAKKKAMDQFEEEKVALSGTDTTSRFKLTETIDSLFRQMLFHNDIKKDAKNHKAAQANMKAVAQAKRAYQSMMNVMTDDRAITQDELKSRHHQALQSATEMFESLKEGDDVIVVGYLENMKADIDREFDNYVRSNIHKADMDRVKEQVAVLQKQLQETQKKPTGECNIL